jgi:hypothetical protein
MNWVDYAELNRLTKVINKEGRAIDGKQFDAEFPFTPSPPRHETTGRRRECRAGRNYLVWVWR